MLVEEGWSDGAVEWSCKVFQALRHHTTCGSEKTPLHLMHEHSIAALSRGSSDDEDIPPVFARRLMSATRELELGPHETCINR